MAPGLAMQQTEHCHLPGTAAELCMLIPFGYSKLSSTENTYVCVNVCMPQHNL